MRACGTYYEGVPWQRWTAYVLAAIAAGTAALACSWSLTWLGTAAVLPLAAGVLILLPVVALGVLVATRRPGNPVGLLLVAAGAIPMSIVVLEWVFGQIWTVAPEALPRWGTLVVAADQGSWMWLYVPGALLMLLFPDGHLPSPRWRWVAAGLVAVPVVFGVLTALGPGAFQPPFEGLDRGGIPSLPGWVRGVSIVLLPVFLGLLVASAASMIVRRRRSTDPVLRAQVRWFALGAIFLPVALLLCWLSYLLLGTPDLGFLILMATPLALAVATVIALLRHDLYDVDKTFALVVTYTVISAVLLGVFTAINVVLGLLLGGGSTLAAVLATAVCALALVPLRTRLQHFISRRVYPQRSEVLDAIASLWKGTDAGTRPPEDLQAVLRAAMGDQDLLVGFRVPGRPGLVDPSGTPIEVESPRAVPVRLGETVIGILLPGSTTASRELLHEVAREIAPLIEVVRLRRELADAVRETEASRRRLLMAGYEERQRLQRNLHDGAQQRLVSLGMSLRLAQRHLPPGSEDLDGLLDQAVAELGTSVAELRAIAHGLGPATLGGGLAPALHTLAIAVPLVVDLELQCDGVPDEVATTAYYVASEALANTVKHAGASHAFVGAQQGGGALTLTVSDDGRGGASAERGSGLAGLADRVAAAGGRLEVDSAAGVGTTIRAVIPCASS